MTFKRFYKNHLPDVDDIVLGKVTSINKYGITVKLIEYDNITAFLNFKDASNKRRLYQIKKQIKINKEYPLTVMDVDQEKTHVNLSKKYQVEEDEIEFLSYYKKYKKCMLVLSNFIRKKNIQDDESKIQVLNNTLWKHDRFDIFNIFNDIKKGKTTVERYFNLESNDHELLYQTINSTLEDEKYTIKIKFKINSLDINGKQSIINYLSNIENALNSTPYIVSIPEYCIEFKNIFEKDVGAFIDMKKGELEKLEKKDVLFAFTNVEKYAYN